MSEYNDPNLYGVPDRIAYDPDRWEEFVSRPDPIVQATPPTPVVVWEKEVKPPLPIDQS